MAQGGMVALANAVHVDDTRARQCFFQIGQDRHAVQPQVADIHTAADRDAVQHGLGEIGWIPLQVFHCQFFGPAGPSCDDLQRTHGLVLPVVQHLFILRIPHLPAIEMQNIRPGIQPLGQLDHPAGFDERDILLRAVRTKL